MHSSHKLSKRLQVFIAVALLSILTACSQPKALVYQNVQHIRVQQVNLQQATLVVDLQFYNPNNYGLSLKNGDLDAWFNNNYLGKATLDERTIVPAHNTFILPVTITAELKNIVSNAIDLLTHQSSDVLVRLQGMVKAGKGGIFINVPIQYEGQQQIRL
jgi:LEA14-like dessication related protein